mgnify:CR=1 FL=1
MRLSGWRRSALLISLLTLSQVTLAGAVDDFRNSWAWRALTLQLTLDQHSPLSQATFLGTHNSYNSRAYATFYRYVDPNQQLSMYDQLRVGARALELDAHWYFKFDGFFNSGHNLLLCHGQDNHLGCSTGDRYLRDGLREIRRWLDEPANRNEVILLYIEDHMDGRYDKAVGLIRDNLGHRVYRPSGSCQGIPMDISKADVLRAGKQVLMITDGCQNANFNSWVFGGIGNSLDGYPTASTDRIDDCNESRFSRDFQNNHIIRYNEDRTRLSALFGSPGAPIDAGMLNQMLKCGGNLAGMDHLRAGDSRLQSGSGIWSWAVNEPNNYNGNEDCAENWGNGRLNDLYCGQVRAFACVDDSGSWLITHEQGNWFQGNVICHNATGGSHRFAVPENSRANEALKAAKQQAAVDRVWVNYHDLTSEGLWIANGRPPVQR